MTQLLELINVILDSVFIVITSFIVPYYYLFFAVFAAAILLRFMKYAAQAVNQ